MTQPGSMTEPGSGAGTPGVSDCRVALTARSAHDRAIIDAGEAIMIGVSPFNSFYRPSTVKTVVEWAIPRFHHVYVLLPGVEAAQRFIVTGMPPRRAVRKVIAAVQDQRSAARTAMINAHYPDPDQHILVWSRMAGNPRYRALRAQIEQAYHCEPAVQTTITEMVTAVLARTPGARPEAAAVAANVPYVLAETPFVVDAPGILGHRTTVFTYHQPIPLYDLLATEIVAELTPSTGLAHARLRLHGDSR
ncbi:tRNA-dependent cyclodipeptide synthase [Nocardia brasiliensis]